MSNQRAPTIDLLLNLVPDHPDQVLTQLEKHPQLASAQDAHGYNLVHAATSYSHIDLLRILVRTYNVSPNITDEDNETPLFVAESVPIATCLVEELGADIGWTNDEGQTAEEKMEEEGDYPLVAAYLRSKTGNTTATEVDSGEEVHAPPPLPNGVKINVGTVAEQDLGDEQAPDPEFRRRIEELAARDDFQTETGQAELRNLVREAVGGLASNAQGDRDVRRRVD